MAYLNGASFKRLFVKFSFTVLSYFNSIIYVGNPLMSVICFFICLVAYYVVNLFNTVPPSLDRHPSPF